MLDLSFKQSLLLPESVTLKFLGCQDVSFHRVLPVHDCFHAGSASHAYATRASLLGCCGSGVTVGY